jgi:hypothetical protein
MQSVIPGLYASPPQPLSFAPSTHVRAFLLKRQQGNLLVYSADTVAGEARAIEGLGGISRRYLNHWHEAAFGGGDRVAETFEAPLFCHEDESQSVSKTSEVGGTFSARHTLGDDVEVIPMFTGDSLYLREGEWVAAVLESSDRASYIESLELSKELDFDVLVPWAATAGQPFHALTDKADARRRIDTILERVRRGDDH